MIKKLLLPLSGLMVLWASHLFSQVPETDRISNGGAAAHYQSDSGRAAPPGGVGDARAELAGDSEESRGLWLKRRAFIESLLAHGNYELIDSLPHLRFNLQAGAVALQAEDLWRIPPDGDPIAQRLRQQELQIPSLLNVGNLLGKGLKFLANQAGGKHRWSGPWARIPSEAELRIMNVLWRGGESTSAEIYAQLDSLLLTYDDVREILQGMADRGLVEQRQISPRDEFTILGTFTIEKSALNARNREHVYQPRMSRETMFTFLDANAFMHSLGSTTGDSLIHNHLRHLVTLLVKEEAKN